MIAFEYDEHISSPLILGNGVSKILILDDDESFRRIYARYLRAEGHEVVEVEDAEKALAVPDSCDMILLDLRMPGTDGPSYIPHLRQAHPKAKIVIASCYDVDHQRRLAVDVDGYFNKTEGCRALAAKIRSALS